MTEKNTIISLIKKIRGLNKNLKSKETPENLFEKCPGCGELLSVEELRTSYYTCKKCNYHFRLGGRARLDLLLDTYELINSKCKFKNPIDFPGYEKKYKKARRETGLEEGVLVARGLLNGISLVVVVMDSNFLMASMGSYIGGEIVRAFDYATRKNLPIVVFSTSGGARMQEGIFSLMEMARTSMAVSKFGESRNLYISYMTNPTTGGVMASFASLGDINLAEPGALLGFAGPRVIRETVGQDLPEGFQRSEFLLEKGFLDGLVDRKYMRESLDRILRLHGYSR